MSSATIEILPRSSLFLELGEDGDIVSTADGDRVLLMAYDHQGRRRMYAEIRNGATNVLHRFTYDDYLCIARNREIDYSYGGGAEGFLWDPTEPVATRPLMCNPSTTPPMLYCHDGNKNVSDMVTVDGTVAAHYEYSSFGKVVMAASDLQLNGYPTHILNPYRFSSEYHDDALGLVYYNYRHYNPGDGRWIGRDSKVNSSDAHDNSLNDYCFVLNSSVKLIDALGNDWIRPNPNWPPVTPARSAPLRTGAKLTIGALLLNIAAHEAINGFSSCNDDEPCPNVQDCLDCCNRQVAIAMAIASAAYLADCAACARLVNPFLIVTCIVAVGYEYNSTLNDINSAHSACLSRCLNR